MLSESTLQKSVFRKSPRRRKYSVTSTDALAEKLKNLSSRPAFEALHQ